MLIGHKKQWQYLIKLAKQEKLPHAFLFSGQEKLGKKTLAMEFVKWFFNQDIEKRPHPDFIFIEPEKKEIQISQIRDCLWKLSLKPVLALYKVALIDKAHFLNKDAQNALLKTLEEPKGKTLIFLITEYPEKIFPTILSRCQILKFFPVEKEEIRSYLKKQKISNSEIEEIIDNSLGRPGLAVDFSQNLYFLEDQKKTIFNFLKVSQSDIATRFQYAQDLAKDYKKLKNTLNILLQYFRKNLISQIQTSNKDNNLFPKTNKLKKIINLIENINFLISYTNVNPRLSLEILMLEF